MGDTSPKQSTQTGLMTLTLEHREKRELEMLAQHFPARPWFLLHDTHLLSKCVSRACLVSDAAVDSGNNVELLPDGCSHSAGWGMGRTDNKSRRRFPIMISTPER